MSRRLLQAAGPRSSVPPSCHINCAVWLVSIIGALATLFVIAGIVATKLERREARRHQDMCDAVTSFAANASEQIDSLEDSVAPRLILLISKK